jgi:hypothetical protein
VGDERLLTDTERANLLAKGWTAEQIAEAAGKLEQRRERLRARGYSDHEVAEIIRDETLAATINLAKSFAQNARRRAERPGVRPDLRAQMRAQARSFAAIGEVANWLKSAPMTARSRPRSDRGHRRAPAPRPVHRRGSRRTASTRAGPGDPDPPGDDEADPALARAGGRW